MVIYIALQNILVEIPEKLVKISDNMFRKIIAALAEKQKWRQLEILVQENRKHHGNNALRDFAKTLDISKVIRHGSLLKQDELIFQILENMLDSGAQIEKGV